VVRFDARDSRKRTEQLPPGASLHASLARFVGMSEPHGSAMRGGCGKHAITRTIGRTRTHAFDAVTIAASHAAHAPPAFAYFV
jgi:hypothetical protein